MTTRVVHVAAAILAAAILAGCTGETKRLAPDELSDIEIGTGLGPLAGKIWRIGLMGHTARRENVDRLVAALQIVMSGV